MTRFLNGPVVAMFLAAACALTAYVLVTGVQTRPSAALTEGGSHRPVPNESRPGSYGLGSPSVNVAYHRGYPVNWRRRYHAEHAHVQRLLHQLHHTRSPQAVATPPHYDAWLCIHRYEGAWDANTGNGYYGGLQADLAFQQAYAPDLLRSKGTADHWTPLEQMWMAERAWRTRGFGPWPNTARMCGLL